MLFDQAPGLKARHGSRRSELFESAAALLVICFSPFSFLCLTALHF
jgi:hypothetical protein